MKRLLNKPGVLIVVTSLCLVAVPFVWNLVGKSDPDAPSMLEILGERAARQWAMRFAPMDSRVRSLIATLKKETFDESIERLIEIEPYQYPGDSYGGELSLAQLNLEEMLSNRRAIKIQYDLERLPKEKRDAKCQEMFAKTFRAHAAINRECFPAEGDPPSHRSGVRREATQLALCAVMFATAKLGRLETLAEQFEQLDVFKQEMERCIAERAPPWDAAQVFVRRHWYVPDNRFQINVLRLAASRTPGDPKNVLTQIDELTNMTKSEIAIVPWYARFASFDNMGPVDTRRGVTKYVFYYDWKNMMQSADPESQQRLIQRIRKLVL